MAPTSDQMDDPPQIRHLRKLVQATLAGADAVPLQQALIFLYGSIRGAIIQAQASGRYNPVMNRFLQGYDRALDAIERLDDALETGDLKVIQAAFEALVVSDREINALLEETARAAG